MDAVVPTTSSRTGNVKALPVFAAFSIILTLMPLRVLLQVRNIPVCALIVAVTISNVYVFLNAILWPTQDQSSWFSGHGVCDIQIATKATLFTLVATSTAGLTKSVADAVNINTAYFINTHKMKQRKLIEQCLFCFAIPILQLALHPLVQERRYVIAHVYGCADMTDDTWLSIVIIYMWPSIFSVLNAYYAVITIRFTCKHRLDLHSTLTSNGSGFTTKKFYKLGVLALSLLIVYLPVTSYYLYLNVPKPFRRYSLQYNRNPATFNQVLYLSPADTPLLLQYDGWVSISMGFLIFGFFGMNGQTVVSYRQFLVRCGFAKCFPCLLQEPQDRRRGGDDGSVRNNPSRSSRISHFNVINMARSLFDGGRRRSSQIRPTSNLSSAGSQYASSRSPSTVNSDHFSLKYPTSPTSILKTGGPLSATHFPLETVNCPQPTHFTSPPYATTTTFHPSPIEPPPARSPYATHTTPIRLSRISYPSRMRIGPGEWRANARSQSSGHAAEDIVRPVSVFDFLREESSDSASRFTDERWNKQAHERFSRSIDSVTLPLPSAASATFLHCNGSPTSIHPLPTSLNLPPFTLGSPPNKPVNSTVAPYSFKATELLASTTEISSDESESGMGDFGDNLDVHAPRKGSGAFKERERRYLAMLKGEDVRPRVATFKRP